jgi:hypothetical protein
MAEEMLTLAADGELGHRALDSRLRALGLVPDRGLTVIAASGADRDLVYAALGMGTGCVRTTYRGCTVLLVQSDDIAVVDEIAELIRDSGADPVLGVSAAVGGAAGLRRALAEALSAHQLALTRPPGERVVRGLQVASHRQLLDFVDPGVLRAFRERVIGPVQRWDEAHGSQLLQTLAAFFANDGHWRRTAATLHIHHNTLHYRLGKIAQLTGRSVDTAGARVDFILALAIHVADEVSALAPGGQATAPATVEPRR